MSSTKSDTKPAAKSANELMTEKSSRRLANFAKKWNLVIGDIRHCVSQTDAMAYVGDVQDRLAVYCDAKFDDTDKGNGGVPMLYQHGKKLSAAKLAEIIPVKAAKTKAAKTEVAAAE